MNREQGEDAAKSRMEGQESAKGIHELVHLLVYVAVVFLVTFLVITYVGQRTQVNGESMYPTLYDKDNLIVDKLSYRFRDPERYDIIVFPYQYDKSTFYIKRIIGMPGETVYIDPRGTIYINGEALQESYGREIIQSAGLAEEEITLGEDEYFVLGDNRNNSSDSRDPNVGNIHKEDILGKAWIRIWPLSKMEVLDHQ